jgi:hypothetical protein
MATNVYNSRMGNRLAAGRLLIMQVETQRKFVAGLILQAIGKGCAQYFSGDRLRQPAGV